MVVSLAEFQPEFQRVLLECGRLRAKLLGDALLSLTMMSIGCSLISSYSLTSHSSLIACSLNFRGFYSECGRLRAKLLGVALLSLRMMSIGCNLISS